MEENDDILENGTREEVVAFLSYYIPLVSTDEDLQEKLQKLNTIMKPKNEQEEYRRLKCTTLRKNLENKNISVLDVQKSSKNVFLVLDKLDNNNSKIFKNKHKENPENYCVNLKNPDYFALKIKNVPTKTTKELEEELCDLVSEFELQDIQRGYLNEKSFLMNVCNCEKVEGIRENAKNDPKIVFDVNKMEKSFREYLKETGYENLYIQDEHRIYLNNYYYNCHQKYIKSQKLQAQA